MVSRFLLLRTAGGGSNFGSNLLDIRGCRL